MKSTVVKINILRDCVHTTKLKLNGDRIGIDGLASIRHSLRLKKGHKVTPLKFYLHCHFKSFNGLKPVMFVDDNPMGCGMMLLKIQGNPLCLYGNAIICLKDNNNGKLVGMNGEQIADMMSAIEVKERRY